MFSTTKKKKFTSNDLDPIIDTINLIDIRSESEYQAGSIRGSLNIPMQDILNNPDDFISKDELYYIICQSGMRSALVTTTLKGQGYKAINVSGGMGGYSGKYAE